jgi:ribonuclease P protein component
MIGRLVQAADFQRLLATPSLQRSAHFAVHHLSGTPSRPVKAAAKTPSKELSTSDTPTCPELVDDPCGLCWLGCVVPKRHARRAVTRSMLKRQIRAAVVRHESGLAGGLWLVRLRGAFARAEFLSADSAVLRAAARAELDRLMARAAV